MLFLFSGIIASYERDRHDLTHACNALEGLGSTIREFYERTGNIPKTLLHADYSNKDGMATA
jgi:hypothetical protein